MSPVSSVSNQPLTHIAVWNDQNRHLDYSFIEKVTNFFFFILNRIISTMVLPATILYSREQTRLIEEDFQTRWSSQPFEPLRNNYTTTPIEVTAPDGAKIRGTYFKNNAAQNNSPTVICFQPNAVISKLGVFNWQIAVAAASKIPFNFVWFDYRGCGESKPENSIASTAKDLILDGDSIYQFVNDKLGVHTNDIHFYGYSLGGGISTQVKKNHTECEGNHVIERSFSSVNDTLYHFLPSLLAYLSGKLFSFLNWNMASADALRETKGRTVIVHHPEDPMMKNDASLYRAIFERGALSTGDIGHLDLSYWQISSNNLHCEPLLSFGSAEDSPIMKISEFLFSSP